MSSVISVNVHEVEVAIPPEGRSRPAVVWVRARPDLRRIYTLAGDILAALGKDRALSGKGRNQQQDVGLASAWMNASGTTDLVVQNAELIHPIILTGLVRLAAKAQTTLWLLHAPPIGDAVYRKIARLATEVGTYADVPQPVNDACVPESEAVRASGVPVPRADFPLFLTALRHLPTSERFRAEQLFHEQRHEFDHRIAEGADARDAARRSMTTLLTAALADGELIPCIRGVQVAAWHREIFVDVNLDVLLTSEERPTIPKEQADELLVRYRQPHRFIAVALTMRQLGIDPIAGLTLKETTEEGDIVIEGTHLPATSDLRCAVRAQRFLRFAEGAEDEDPLLNYAAKSLTTFIRDAAHDLGIQAAGRRTERQINEIRWLKSLGIKIESIP